MTKTHLFIPDVQVKPKQSLKHLVWAARYALDKRPDRIVFAGDFSDVPSLSSWDKGRLAFEGRRYSLDVDATRRAVDTFMEPLVAVPGYSPDITITLGNHEQRILRASEESPALQGTIGIEDLGYEDAGWTVYPFLEVVTLDGIAYSHFFPRSSAGKVVQTRNGAPSARAQLVREGRSCTAGHAQGLDIACAPLAGRLQWGLIAGSYYLHNEDYLGPQGNNHWRGLVLKNGVRNGTYSPILVDMDYLARRYKPLRRV